MAISLGRKLAAAAKIETTYGTPPAFNQATDALLLYENQNPIQVEPNVIDIVPIRPSFTKVKSIIGRQLYRFSGVTFLQGPENLGAGTPWRFGPLLRACGLQQTVNAASSIIYAPRSSNFESLAMELYMDGYKHVMAGAYGTVTFEAAAGEGMRCTFDMTGLYAEPTVVAIPAQTLETVKAPTFVSASAFIAGQAVVLKSVRFTLGVAVSERLDANAANALAGLIITDRNPTVEMVVEVDTFFRNYFADLTAATTHALSWTLGTTSGNRTVFSFPQAQLTAHPYGDSNSIRTFNLSYKIQHSTDEAEFQIIQN